ncbi:MAG: site-2 protease family protein [Clostridia bacterium]|nr:site-2 protease family protein [Clostridia bacterium]
MMVVAAAVVIFFTLPIHEWAHGFVSTKLGDPTPRMQGRLTLNPMAHIDWIGAISILLVGIGWAKPVQVNARYYKYPKWGMALTALAGPLSNLILAFLAILLFYLIETIFIVTGIYLELYEIVSVMGYFFGLVARINVSLAIFNLIPLPPFDGSRILFTFLPQKYYFKIMQYEQFIFIGVFALLCSGVLDLPLEMLTQSVLNTVVEVAYIPFELFGV